MKPEETHQCLGARSEEISMWLISIRSLLSSAERHCTPETRRQLVLISKCVREVERILQNAKDFKKNQFLKT